MGKTAVLLLVLAASLAFAPPDRTHVRFSLPARASISVKADPISRTVWQPIPSISLGDIIDAIIRALSQLIDK
jgi:hypothetical protein